MTQDITTTGPSRRSIAKGAAWAVPAVSVAAAAPSLAASPDDCGPGSLTVGVEDCRLVGLLSPEASFTITNPAGSGCTVPAGTPISITGLGLLGISVGDLNNINVGLLFNDTGNATTTTDLAPGSTLNVRVFPSGLNVNVLGTYSMTILGSMARFRLTAGVGGLLSVCRVV